MQSFDKKKEGVARIKGGYAAVQVGRVLKVESQGNAVTSKMVKLLFLIRP